MVRDIPMFIFYVGDVHNLRIMSQMCETCVLEIPDEDPPFQTRPPQKHIVHTCQNPVSGPSWYRLWSRGVVGSSSEFDEYVKNEPNVWNLRPRNSRRGPPGSISSVSSYLPEFCEWGPRIVWVVGGCGVLVGMEVEEVWEGWKFPSGLFLCEKHFLVSSEINVGILVWKQ